MTLPVVLMPIMRQLPLDLALSIAPSLAEFEVGNNLELIHWFSTWPDHTPRTHPIPTYLWGPAGCGKSYLLRTLAYRAHGLNWQVLWLSSQGLQSLQSNAQAPTLVLIDGCHELDEMQQHWVFNMFIESADALTNPSSNNISPIWLVAAGQCPPVDLPIREDLRTRLAWGLVFAVQPLPEENIAIALVRESKRRGLKCADGVVPYMLTHCNRDLGFLMQLLDRFDRFGLAEKRELTIPLLKQMLEQEQHDLNETPQ